MCCEAGVHIRGERCSATSFGLLGGEQSNFKHEAGHTPSGLGAVFSGNSRTGSPSRASAGPRAQAGCPLGAPTSGCFVDPVTGNIGFLGENKVTGVDADGNVVEVSTSANAVYPNKKFDNPNGWRFKGQTVALARGVVNTNVGGVFQDVRTNANSARWYMSPGHAISGAANIARSGRVAQFTQGRSRSSLGTAQGGVLNWGLSTGVVPWAAKLIPNNIYSEIDQKVNNDAGNAAAGFLNIQKSFGGKVAIRNFPGATAATAVGNAVAGGVTIAYSEAGKAQIGDYDQENDSPENDVAATTRGRGTAEAGLISVAIAPNDDASALGDIKATANQGSAVAGAFTITNGYATSEQGVDVNSRTSEYQAIAGNAQSKVASSAETKDGRAQSLAGALSAAAVNSIASATSSGASETGDVTSNAQAGAIGVFHGEAAATSSSGTGCIDCISDSVANAVATGVVADSLARSAADSDKNPGNALANAISVGLISRTSNGGSSRIAVGPAQAISGGFAVSAGKKVQDTMAKAINPESKAGSVAAQIKA
ncbi:hypothetical protein OEZ85_013477 [Tetradesmus obliquus]|uniref:Uncharacterized protein n=1 Tax=Tetradesmus obliquus TaxID=3088 RepID=A0ABY8UQT1_TETOB|nr:hypothetical protein OEZ85_013477 [Tetradesmus obliquus]